MRPVPHQCRDHPSARTSLAGLRAPGMREGWGGRSRAPGRADPRIHRPRSVCEYSASTKVLNPGDCRAYRYLGRPRSGLCEWTGRAESRPSGRELAPSSRSRQSHVLTQRGSASITERLRRAQSMGWAARNGGGTAFWGECLPKRRERGERLRRGDPARALSSGFRGFTDAASLRPDRLGPPSPAVPL